MFTKLLKLERSSAAYMNPSAACPVCGQAVFFYQSANGGRVFFDELGPPWPKHPCTDSGRPSAYPRRGSPSPAGVYRWQAERWTPFLLSVVTSFTPGLLRLSGTAGERDLTLYLAKRPFIGMGDPRELIEQSHLHCKIDVGETYRMEILTPSLTTLNLIAYSSSVDAMNVRRSSEKRVFERKRITIVRRKKT